MAHTARTKSVYWPNSATLACAGAARRGSGSIPPAACTNVLAACRLRFPDLGLTPRRDVTEFEEPPSLLCE